VLPESDAAALEGALMDASVQRGVESKALRSTDREEAPAPPATRPAPPARGPATPSLPGPDVYGYRLPNGIRLYVVPRRDVPVVAARAAFAGGLLAENADTAGLSSFTASMWLRGTQSLSAAEFARQTEGLAAEIDGFSGRSSLGLTLETLAEKLEPALELFAQVLLEPAFESAEIEKERRETLAAIDRREDRLAQRAFLLFAETHYRSHPYRQPLLGTRHAVPRFDRDLIRAHHDRLIRARNCTLAFAGDVDPDDLAMRISALLGGLDAGAFQAPDPSPEAAPREIRTAELRKERAQGHLVIGFRGLCVDDEDRFALEVISQLLAGQGGRLFLELRDRRSLAYTVNAVNVEGVAPGYFGVYIATAPDKLEAARRGLLEELQRVVDGPPDPADLERAKRYLIGNFAIDQQRNASHAALVSLDSLYGLGPDAYRAYPDRVESVTSEDVLRVARRVIDLTAYTQAQVRP
jgi:zinc protease